VADHPAHRAAAARPDHPDLIFLSVIGSLQLFDLVWIMTLGGPADSSSTMATYLIDTASGATSSATAARWP